MRLTGPISCHSHVLDLPKTESLTIDMCCLAHGTIPELVFSGELSVLSSVSTEDDEQWVCECTLRRFIGRAHLCLKGNCRVEPTALLRVYPLQSFHLGGFKFCGTDFRLRTKFATTSNGPTRSCLYCMIYVLPCQRMKSEPHSPRQGGT